MIRFFPLKQGLRQNNHRQTAHAKKIRLFPLKQGLRRAHAFDEHFLLFLIRLFPLEQGLRHPDGRLLRSIVHKRSAFFH